MTVSDYIWSCLADRGVDTVFYLPGGGSMHLVDALARQDRITPVAMLHEQSCAIAAAAYAMYKNDLGVACVTTGPGGTNAITGIAAAWTDYVPLVVISGQVPTHMMMEEVDTEEYMARRTEERQRGPQEVDIATIVHPITKDVTQLKMCDMCKSCCDAQQVIPWCVDMALGYKRGPVWLDVPLDVQCAENH